MTNVYAQMAQIEVTAGHSPFAYIYGLFVPTITIDGLKHKRNWGTHLFDVAPGTHEVSVSYPWILAPECGKNTVRLSVLAGETKKVNYQARIIRYIPGKIRVE